MHRLQGHDHLGCVDPGSGLGKPPSRPEVPEELSAAHKLEREEDAGMVLFRRFVFFFFFLGSRFSTMFLVFLGACLRREQTGEKKEKRKKEKEEAP